MANANFVGDGVYAEFPVAEGAKIGMGNLVAINENGYAVPLPPFPNQRFAGIAVTSADNSGGSNGAVSVVVQRVGTVELDIHPGATFTQSSVGTTAYGDFSGVSTAHNNSAGRTAVGSVVAVLGNRVRIDIRRFTF